MVLPFALAAAVVAAALAFVLVEFIGGGAKPIDQPEVKPPAAVAPLDPAARPDMAPTAPSPSAPVPSRIDSVEAG